jgi:hypothetical protein
VDAFLLSFGVVFLATAQLVWMLVGRLPEPHSGERQSTTKDIQRRAGRF